MPASEKPETVVIQGRRLRLTNLAKVLYPATGTTKAEVLAYLTEIGAGHAPALRRAPGHPQAVAERRGHRRPSPGEVFFIKNLEPSAPEWVVRADIGHSSGAKTYPLVDDVATLVWLGQVAALEVHVPQWTFGSDGERAQPRPARPRPRPGPGHRAGRVRRGRADRARAAPGHGARRRCR